MRVLSPLTVLCLTGCLTSYDQGYQDAVRDFGADASSLQDTIDDLTARLEALEGASGGNAASVEDLDALATRVTAIEADYATDAEVTAVATDVTDLETLVTTDYATIVYVDSVATGTVDLTTYVQRSELDAYALDSDLVGFALSSELANYALSTDLDAYALSTDLDAYALSTDLDAYALITDLDTVVADLGTLDANTPDFIGADLTINVDAAGNGDFTDIPSALDSIANSFIAANAVVTIQVADGTYAMSGPLEFYHPQGRNVAIRGNVADPTLVTLEFPINSTGLYVHWDATLGDFTGFRLRQAAGGTGGNAIVATDGGTILCGQFYECSLITDGWPQAGAYAMDRGFVHVPSIQASNSQHGVWVRDGGFVNAANGEFSNQTGSGVVVEGGGAYVENATATAANTGFNVGTGGVLHAAGTSATDSTGNGYRASLGGVLRATDAQAVGSGSHGFIATENSVVYGTNASSTDNTQWGYIAGSSGFIFALNATASGNGVGDINSPNTLTTTGSYVQVP